VKEPGPLLGDHEHVILPGRGVVLDRSPAGNLHGLEPRERAHPERLGLERELLREHPAREQGADPRLLSAHRRLLEGVLAVFSSQLVERRPGQILEAQAPPAHGSYLTISSYCLSCARAEVLFASASRRLQSSGFSSCMTLATSRDLPTTVVVLRARRSS
jgi:hypothetical protein